MILSVGLSDSECGAECLIQLSFRSRAVYGSNDDPEGSAYILVNPAALWTLAIFASLERALKGCNQCQMHAGKEVPISDAYALEKPSGH